MAVSTAGKARYLEDKHQIKKAREEKQLVLFVGAGASIDAGMPSWNKAVTIIADRLGIKRDYDYLKIPQYYYNSRSKKEYVQLMHEIFRYKEELESQPVHDRIIEFNTETIITTNYDHLIEQAAKKNREFIQVISKDTDLPYRKAGKELIKMHGDFEKDNFVLKEDDYLHYQKNFRLIENYVKSIIGVKTILFIGYSLNDPDVKQILAWVGEILDNDVQHAYLIKADGKFDELEYEYFHHLGVNLIYSTTLLNHDKGITKNLLETLDFLLAEETQEDGLIGLLYDELCPFEKLNYTYFRYIERAFYKDEIRRYNIHISNDGYLYYSGKDKKAEGAKLINDFVSIINGKNVAKVDNRVKILYDIFRRSAVEGVRTKNRNKNEDYSFTDRPRINEALFNFDYRDLYETKRKNTSKLVNDNVDLYLQQAMIASFLYDYETAFTCLGNAVDILYKRKEYAKYFIALFSKKNIGTIIISDPYSDIDENYKKKVKMELAAINLEKTLATIPELGNDDNYFLKDLLNFKFASELFYNAYKASNKAKKEASQTYIVYGGIPAYQELRTRVFDYYLYCQYNNILVDRFHENNDIFDIYARSLVASLAAPNKEKEANLGPWIYSRNIHVEELSINDIHLLLRYVDRTVLSNLFTDFSVKRIKLSSEAKEYIRLVTDTIPYIIKNGNKWYKGSFERLLLILSHIEIDEDIAVKILRNLVEIEESGFFHRYRDSIDPFYKAIWEQKAYSSEQFCKLANALLTKLFEYSIEEEYYPQLVWNQIAALVNCCFAENNPYSNTEVIIRLLEMKNYRLIVDLYPVLSEETKEKIKNYISIRLDEDEFSDPYLYAKMIAAEIRKPELKAERKCYVFFENNIKKSEAGINEGYFGNPLIQFVNLYLNNLLIDRRTFESIVMRTDDEGAKWVMDPVNYDYEKFQIQWLYYCTNDYLVQLNSNERIKKKILNRFHREYLDGKTDNKETTIVIEHFLVDSD